MWLNGRQIWMYSVLALAYDENTLEMLSKGEYQENNLSRMRVMPLILCTSTVYALMTVVYTFRLLRMESLPWKEDI